MKLLLANYKNKWKNDILRSFFYLINILVGKYNYILVDLSDVNLNSDFNSILKKYPDAKSVLVIENHDGILINHLYPNFFLSKIKKYLFADDIHKFKELKVNYYENFDTIFVTYYHPFLNLYPNVETNKVIWCPHGYTVDYLIKYNNNPNSKILLSGAIGLLYPVRKHLLKLSQNELKGKINHLKHPGYKMFDYKKSDKIIGKTYAQVLNNNLSCFTDCLTYGFIVSKYFEIPATGSLLLAVNPEHDKLEKLGFINNVNYIECNKDNILDKILWILDHKNKKKVDEIRQKGMEMVRSKHSIEERANLINTIMNKNYNN